MKILFVTGYNAWDQISKGVKPSHHLFGIHELIDHYEKRPDGSTYGILKKDAIEGVDGGEVDFYIWESVRKDVLGHIHFMITKGNQYDLVYDCLNRCSIWVGMLKKLGLFKPRIVTMLHHPSYKVTLKLAASDAYVFFNEDYRKIAVRECPGKRGKYHVNEWFPDTPWYRTVESAEDDHIGRAFFIDNGKTERDRDLMIRAAEETKLRIDYAGNSDDTQGYARAYKMDMTSYVDITKKMMGYSCILIPIHQFNKEKIGPLGITSFLDCMALGCPVIASDNTCFAGEVRDKELGYIYKTGDIESLKNGMRLMAGDSEYYSKCRDNIMRYAETRTIASFSDNLRRIFNVVLVDASASSGGR